MTIRTLVIPPILVAVVGLGCAAASPHDSAFSTGVGGEDSTEGDTGDESDTGEDRFDVAGDGGGHGGCSEGGDCEGKCEFPAHAPCDVETDDPFAAMGLNCPDEPQAATTVSGAPGARAVIDEFGSSGTFAAREGERMAIIGTGRINDIDRETPDSDNVVNPIWCNYQLPVEHSPGESLPPPLVAEDVGKTDCWEDPSLIGTGDCSNTIQGQFLQGKAAYDYTDLRVELDVPAGVQGFRFDFAFFTVEYPKYYQTGYNDMFVTWVESERWTGNISFDEQGNPISLNASFMEYLDDDLDLPEFEGTCMRGHAGTDWLETSFPLEEGEHVEIVFAVFDLQDGKLDSYVILDDFEWVCDGHVTPGTKPIP